MPLKERLCDGDAGRTGVEWYAHRMQQLIEEQVIAQGGGGDLFIFLLLTLVGAGYKNGRQTRKDWEMNEIREHGMKYPKTQ